MAEMPLPEGSTRLDHAVPARGAWSGRVEAGEILRIVDLEGRQAVDFPC